MNDPKKGILDNYKQPKPKPPKPVVVREQFRMPDYERPDWPPRADHEAERKAILDREAIYLRPEEVAARYGLPVAWVYRCQGLKKYRRKAGKYVVFRLADLIEFEEERKHTENRGFTLDVRRPHVERDPNDTAVNPLKFDIL